LDEQDLDKHDSDEQNLDESVSLMTDPILSVRNLQVEFASRRGTLRAIDGVSLDIAKGEVLGVVGESGAGKSVTGLAVIGLIDPPGRIAGGEIRLAGLRIDNLTAEELRRIRGKRIGMIFQDPLTSLNPLYRVGDQIVETIRTHLNLSETAARRRAIDLLAEVGIPAPEKRIDGYPHEFSGGMNQRVMIAMAIACNPQILIADEPTTALDVTIQAQILDLMLELKARTGAAVILITHNLGIVAETCARVIVMYAGRKIEEAATGELFDRPAHPYTRGLMASIPRLRAKNRKRRLAEIPGIVPSLREPIEGCAFAPRCAYAVARCRVESPELRPIGTGHVVACHEAERVLGETPVAA